MRGGQRRASIAHWHVGDRRRQVKAHGKGRQREGKRCEQQSSQWLSKLRTCPSHPSAVCSRHWSLQKPTYPHIVCQNIARHRISVASTPDVKTLRPSHKATQKCCSNNLGSAFRHELSTQGQAAAHISPPRCPVPHTHIPCANLARHYIATAFRHQLLTQRHAAPDTN